MKDVYITDNKGAVDTSSVRLSKNGNEQVIWHSRVDQDATVRFDGGSPFRESQFTVPAGKNVPSGPPIVAASATTEYKYTVIGHDGENDPIVIVDN